MAGRTCDHPEKKLAEPDRLKPTANTPERCPIILVPALVAFNLMKRMGHPPITRWALRDL